jgi:(1->4)-alpha-D-glucan 1-alpha-D-glucosylmutase
MVVGRMTQIPLSTYRLQFNRNFTFAQATEILPYLAALGISHCYASPYLRARPGSTHGYDIIDHQHLNPEIGTPEDYDKFVATLHQYGMGQILDVVPNHMGVMGSDNAWWLDVLENGEASAYADFFDIDWEPLKDELQGKVLVPVLADQYGVILDRGELKLTFDREKGEFNIFYFHHRFPVNPKGYPSILTLAAEQVQSVAGAHADDLLELQSLISAFGHLPGREDPALEKRQERVRDKEINKKRLAALCARSHQIAAFVEGAVATMNGTAGESASFDSLHELIKAQAFRLAYWRVAADDINYRRFFDVNDLAAIRQENEAVFTKTHELILQLLKEGKINGLRIDHPDGLYNPGEYFHRLQLGAKVNDATTAGRNVYVVAEKILSGDEQISQQWPIHGTTGYDFANLVNGLFVDPDAEQQLTQVYHSFIGDIPDFKEVVYRCKKLVMDRSLNSELNVLANHLSRIALADRHTCDFTLKTLRDALTEIVACFPVYRTYVAGQGVSETDQRYIADAVECAKRKSTSADSSVYDFMREVLLTRQAEGHPQFYQNSVVHFAMRFQQYSSAVMAKGFEDTSLYRYHRLVSLNDVGADPLQFGVSPSQFHCEMQKRVQHWPHSMLATSTHDSKRSEDVRARIDVLSEMPEAWAEHLVSWRKSNSRFKGQTAPEMPTPNDEFLFYQTLIGAWPLPSSSADQTKQFSQRITEYMLKAMREAKDSTSWANPNQEYEAATADFVTAVLENKLFLDDFVPFQRTVSHFGMLNSLSQTLLKLTAPGVPDTYQGNECWEFNLVDPDNRRSVDYGMRLHSLNEIQASERFSDEQLLAYSQRLSENMNDRRIKMYVTWRALTLRNLFSDAFRYGDYTLLQARGAYADHVLAFTRTAGGSQFVVIVPRLNVRLSGGDMNLPTGSAVWQDTVLELPENAMSLRNIFTGEHICPSRGNRGCDLSIASALNAFPVALLTLE